MIKSFFKKMFKKAEIEIKYRDIAEAIADAELVLKNAKEIAGKSQDIMSPQHFPHVAIRDGHTTDWKANAAVTLAEENLLILEERKANGAEFVEIEHAE
jgi:hypothetical protein